MTNCSEKQLDFYNKYSECLNSCINQMKLTFVALQGSEPAKDVNSIIKINIVSSPILFKAAKDAATEFIKELDENYKTLINSGPAKILQFFIKQRHIN